MPPLRCSATVRESDSLALPWGLNPRLGESHAPRARAPVDRVRDQVVRSSATCGAGPRARASDVHRDPWPVFRCRPATSPA